MSRVKGVITSPIGLMAREYGVTYRQIYIAGVERLKAMKPEARDLMIATMKRSTKTMSRGKGNK